MIRGLTNSGIAPIEDPIDYIRKAAMYGFQSIELDAEVLIKKYGSAYILSKLEQYNVQLGAFHLCVNWTDSEHIFQCDLAHLTARAKAHAKLGSRTCATYIPPSTTTNPAYLVLQAVKRLQLVADILQEHDIQLAIEFVGAHHLRTQKTYPFLFTLEHALSLIEAINRPNVGLLIDSYHCYTTQINWEQLRSLPVSLIKYVHINDAKPLPAAQLRDHDRLYIGEGIIDLYHFIEVLKDMGYQGIIAQEVITPFTSKNLDETLHRSRIGYDILFMN